MAFPLAVPIIDAVLKIVDKVIPDPAAQAEAKLKALTLLQSGELEVFKVEGELAKGQLEVNKAEAESTDFFRGGWRPAVGWICATAFAVQFVVGPLAPWLATVAGLTVPAIPSLDMEMLLTVLLGMLGLGGFRTYEKVKGVAK